MLGSTQSVEAPPIASLLLLLAITGGRMGVVRGTEPADDAPEAGRARGAEAFP